MSCKNNQLKSLLHRLVEAPAGLHDNRSQFSFTCVGISESCFKTSKRDFADGSSTIENWFSKNDGRDSNQPWMNALPQNTLMGWGVLSPQKEISRIKWKTFAEVGNMTFEEAFGAVQLHPGESYLIVYNSISLDEYNSEKNELEARLDELQSRLDQMHKVRRWMPQIMPHHRRRT
jgi:hypothetical protein